MATGPPPSASMTAIAGAVPMYEPGDIIFEDAAYVSVLNDEERGKRCDFCFRCPDRSLLAGPLGACAKCKFVHYCSKECQRGDWPAHKTECKRILSLPENLREKLANAMVRLMARIVDRDVRGDNVSVKSGIYKRSFDDLEPHVEELRQQPERMQRLQIIVEALKYFLRVPDPLLLLKYDDAFFTRVFGRIAVNSYGVTDELGSSDIGTAIYLDASRLDHSCKPNAVTSFHGTAAHIRALEPIPKAFLDLGPKKMLSRIRTTYSVVDLLQLASTKKRKEKLKKKYLFECDCQWCNEDDLSFLGRCPECEGLVQPGGENGFLPCEQCGYTLSGDEMTLIKQIVVESLIEHEKIARLMEKEEYKDCLDRCHALMLKQDQVFHQANRLSLKTIIKVFTCAYTVLPISLTEEDPVDIDRRLEHLIEMMANYGQLLTQTLAHPLLASLKTFFTEFYLATAASQQKMGLHSEAIDTLEDLLEAVCRGRGPQSSFATLVRAYKSECEAKRQAGEGNRDAGLEIITDALREMSKVFSRQHPQWKRMQELQYELEMPDLLTGGGSGGSGGRSAGGSSINNDNNASSLDASDDSSLSTNGDDIPLAMAAADLAKPPAAQSSVPLRKILEGIPSKLSEAEISSSDDLLDEKPSTGSIAPSNKRKGAKKGAKMLTIPGGAGGGGDGGGSVVVNLRSPARNEECDSVTSEGSEVRMSLYEAEKNKLRNKKKRRKERKQSEELMQLQKAEEKKTEDATSASHEDSAKEAAAIDVVESATETAAYVETAPLDDVVFESESKEVDDFTPGEMQSSKQSLHEQKAEMTASSESQNRKDTPDLKDVCVQPQATPMKALSILSPTSSTPIISSTSDPLLKPTAIPQSSSSSSSSIPQSKPANIPILTKSSTASTPPTGNSSSKSAAKATKAESSAKSTPPPPPRPKEKPIVPIKPISAKPAAMSWARIVAKTTPTPAPVAATPTAPTSAVPTPAQTTNPPSTADPPVAPNTSLATITAATDNSTSAPSTFIPNISNSTESPPQKDEPSPSTESAESMPSTNHSTKDSQAENGGSAKQENKLESKHESKQENKEAEKPMEKKSKPRAKSRGRSKKAKSQGKATSTSITPFDTPSATPSSIATPPFSDSNGSETASRDHTSTALTESEAPVSANSAAATPQQTKEEMEARMTSLLVKKSDDDDSSMSDKEKAGIAWRILQFCLASKIQKVKVTQDAHILQEPLGPDKARSLQEQFVSKLCADSGEAAFAVKDGSSADDVAAATPVENDIVRGENEIAVIEDVEVTQFKEFDDKPEANTAKLSKAEAKKSKSRNGSKSASQSRSRTPSVSLDKTHSAKNKKQKSGTKGKKTGDGDEDLDALIAEVKKLDVERAAEPETPSRRSSSRSSSKAKEITVAESATEVAPALEIAPSIPTISKERRDYVEIKGNYDNMFEEFETDILLSMEEMQRMGKMSDRMEERLNAVQSRSSNQSQRFRAVKESYKAIGLDLQDKLKKLNEKKREVGQEEEKASTSAEDGTLPPSSLESELQNALMSSLEGKPNLEDNKGSPPPVYSPIEDDAELTDDKDAELTDKGYTLTDDGVSDDLDVFGAVKRKNKVMSTSMFVTPTTREDDDEDVMTSSSRSWGDALNGGDGDAAKEEIGKVENAVGSEKSGSASLQTVSNRQISAASGVICSEDSGLSDSKTSEPYDPYKGKKKRKQRPRVKSMIEI